MLRKSALGLFMIVVALDACSHSEATPGPSSGAAFMVMGPLRQEACGHDACVRQRVMNHGTRAGDGMCQLQGKRKEAAGPIVKISSLAPGHATMLTARWKHPIPNGGLRFLCDPGMGI